MLSDQLKKKLSERNISELFPIQKEAIENFYKTNHDLCIQSPTGSGKTLAYLLPIFQQLLQNPHCKKLRVLILVPTRDLVEQVWQVAHWLGKDFGIQTVGCIGGGVVIQKRKRNVDLKKEKKNNLNRDKRELLWQTNEKDLNVTKAQILISTPGRILDLLDDISFSQLEYFVIDEADRIFEQDSMNWLPALLTKFQQIIQYRPESDMPVSCSLNNFEMGFSSQLFDPFIDRPARQPVRQRIRKILVSATLNIFSLPLLSLYKPIQLPVKQHGLPPNLKISFIRVENVQDKPYVLLNYLLRNPRKTMLFCNQIQTAQYLFNILQQEQKLKVFYYSSSLSQLQRQHVISEFEAENNPILLTTDALSRGLDLEKIQLVIHYEYLDLSTFIHRSGRTARGLLEGESFSIFTKEEIKVWKETMKEKDLWTQEIQRLPNPVISEEIRNQLDALIKKL